jgi:hypothetical protein
MIPCENLEETEIYFQKDGLFYDEFVKDSTFDQWLCPENSSIEVAGI